MSLNLSLLGDNLLFRGSLFQSSGSERRMFGSHMLLSGIFWVAAGRQRMSGGFLLERSVAVDHKDKMVLVHSELCSSEGALWIKCGIP